MIYHHKWHQSQTIMDKWWFSYQKWQTLDSSTSLSQGLSMVSARTSPHAGLSTRNKISLLWEGSSRQKWKLIVCYSIRYPIGWQTVDPWQWCLHHNTHCKQWVYTWQHSPLDIKIWLKIKIIKKIIDIRRENCQCCFDTGVFEWKWYGDDSVACMVTVHACSFDAPCIAESVSRRRAASDALSWLVFFPLKKKSFVGYVVWTTMITPWKLHYCD